MEKSTISKFFDWFQDSIDFRNKNLTLGELCVAEKEFRKLLSPELLNAFEKFINAELNDSIFENNFFFTEGFKLGLNLGIEVQSNYKFDD